MSVVTKTGDKGETGLLSGERVAKTDPRVETYGTLDELVSAIGFVLSFKPSPEIFSPLKKIEADLFRLGAELASTKLDPRWKISPMGKADVEELEGWVGQLEPRLELPRAFVLPGGSPCSAALDVARCVARRLERRMAGLIQAQIYKNPFALQYVNRLSDLLFIFARWEQKQGGIAYEPV